MWLSIFKFPSSNSALHAYVPLDEGGVRGKPAASAATALLAQVYTLSAQDATKVLESL